MGKATFCLNFSSPGSYFLLGKKTGSNFFHTTLQRLDNNKKNIDNIKKMFRAVTFQEMLIPSSGNVNDYLTHMSAYVTYIARRSDNHLSKCSGTENFCL